jgi:hypothetical protein
MWSPADVVVITRVKMTPCLSKIYLCLRATTHWCGHLISRQAVQRS